MHRLALAARQVVFYVLWNRLAWGGFVENNGVISSNSSQLSGHLDVHLGEAKLSVSIQNLDELSGVPWRLRLMHDDLLAAEYRAQHCAWVQCIVENTCGELTSLSCVINTMRSSMDRNTSKNT